MKILLVQTSFLGDLILSTPVIAALKKLYPQASLWMLTTPQARELVERDPLLAGIMVFDKRKTMAGPKALWDFARELKSMRFDKVYALQRSFRTSLLLWLSRIPSRTGFRQASWSCLYHELADRPKHCHDVQRNLSILTNEAPLENLDAALRLFPPGMEELSALTQSVLKGEGDYVVVAPGSTWYTKMWHTDGYRQLVSYLLARQKRVVLVGARAEEKIGLAVAEGQTVTNLIGQITLAESLAVVKQAKLVICNDSMVLHMASAFKIPAVAIFCATSPDFGFGPWQNKSLVVEKKGLSCKPCRRHGSRACPNGTEACIKDLDCSEVIRAVEQLL